MAESVKVSLAVRINAATSSFFSTTTPGRYMLLAFLPPAFLVNVLFGSKAVAVILATMTNHPIAIEGLWPQVINPGWLSCVIELVKLQMSLWFLDVCMRQLFRNYRHNS